MSRAAVFAATILCAGVSFAGTGAGTDGTATSYDENKAVLLVVPCDKNEAGAWEYTGCVRELREKTVELLCKKKGKGTFKWSFQVGAEKSTLSQATTCK